MVRGSKVFWLGAALGVGVFAACGAFEASSSDTPPREEGGISDAGSTSIDDSGSTTDAGAPSRCDPTADFGPPALVPSLNFKARHSLSARQAGDFLYFSSDRHEAKGDFSGVDIYRARFAGDGFTDIVQLKRISTLDVEDVAPTESDDHLTLYFALGDIDVRRIRRASRPTATEPYLSTAAVTSSGTFLDNATQESDPYLVGKRLYFSAASALTGGTSLIYSVDLSETGVPSVPTLVAGPFNGKLRYPVVNAAETELYFVEYIGSTPTVYLARRKSTGAPFTEPAAQPGLLVPGTVNANVTGLSADGCDLYLAHRVGDAGFDIYRSRRALP